MVNKKPNDDHVEKSGHTRSIEGSSKRIVENRKQKLAQRDYFTLARANEPISASQVFDAIDKLVKNYSFGKAGKDRLLAVKEDVKKIGFAVAASRLDNMAKAAGLTVHYLTNSVSVVILHDFGRFKIRRTEKAEYRESKTASNDQNTASKSKVATKTQIVAELPHIMRLPSEEIKKARKEFERISSIALPNLTVNERARVLNDAYELDADSVAMAQFRAASAAQPTKPLPWSKRPKSLKLIEFLRMEYRDKGFIGRQGFNRKSLAEIDEEAAKAVASYTRFKALPPDVDVPKAVNRKNERERAGLDKAENWNRRKPQ